MTREAPARASNASRYLFLFLFGLVVGAMIAVFALRAIKARQDPFPDSVMQVMEKQFALLDAGIGANRCMATDTLPRLQTLRLVGNDIETAYPDLAEDARFAGHARQLLANLDAAIAAAPADCGAARAARAKAVESCKACHRDFGD
ncbi:MAG TPA: hypothetical protein VFF96_10910 [Pseudoxanthomonas sp.]|nr:hypothetical protein [Pseudoxanthomonas sp.]